MSDVDQSNDVFIQKKFLGCLVCWYALRATSPFWSLIALGVREMIDKPSPPPFILTRHVGNYDSQIAQYTIAHIINRERGFLQCYKNQLDCKWYYFNNNLLSKMNTPKNPQIVTFALREYPVEKDSLRVLSSLTIGILGVGAIGIKGRLGLLASETLITESFSLFVALI